MIKIDSVVGSVEANGYWKVTSVADANTFTFDLDAMTAYTSGGTANKLSMRYFDKGAINSLLA